MSSATTRSRPMINTRDEPHAHADLYRRMHVIVGDSTMAEPTTLLKVGATDLILRLLEARVPMPDLALAREMQAIRDVAHDLTGKATVELADGRHLTAVEVQQAYLDLVRSHLDGIIERTRRGDAILDLWERGIDAVRTQDFSLVETELDWAIKHKIVTRYQERLGLRSSTTLVSRASNSRFTTSRRNTGCSIACKRRDSCAASSPKPQIETAKTVAPTPPARTCAVSS